MDNNTVPLAAIGLAGTICAGFFALLSSALKDLTKSNRRIADEAKKRNGHLAELIIQQGETSTKLANRNLKATRDTQNIRQQHVEHQHIEKIEEPK